MMLVFEGNANVVAKSKVKNKKLIKDCVEGETPLHEAKTGKILRILLSKTTPQQLMAIDKFEDKPLFDQILKHHPSTLQVLNFWSSKRYFSYSQTIQQRPNCFSNQWNYSSNSSTAMPFKMAH